MKELWDLLLISPFLFAGLAAACWFLRRFRGPFKPSCDDCQDAETRARCQTLEEELDLRRQHRNAS